MYRNMNTYAFTENRLIKKAAEAAFFYCKIITNDYCGVSDSVDSSTGSSVISSSTGKPSTIASSV